MTLIRLHDIREADVHPDAGMSNIPWEYEYGFQREADILDDQSEILDELYFFGSTSTDEGVLDGLSPDAPTYRGNTIVQVGTFLTRCTVRRNGELQCVTVSREALILEANRILRAAAELAKYEVQREYIHDAPRHVTYVYEVNPAEVKSLIIDGEPYPLSQLLDLRGFPSVGKMGWEEDVD